MYTESGFRQLVIGKYANSGQRFVPHNEAPIRDLRSPRGWRVIVSSFLRRDESPEAGLRVRFFGPDGKIRRTDKILMTLEEVELGNLFGATDDILAITSNEEHSYNSSTDIWLLPERGEPRELIAANATLGKFSRVGRDARPGVWIKRQSYDGVHAETKGGVDEFWLWDPTKKSLALDRK
jgi:hypothetical protein